MSKNPDPAYSRQHNPEVYQELSRPRPLAEIDASLEAFQAELYELRVKHKIPELMVILMVTAEGDEPGKSGTMLLSLNYGDATKAESMAAWALGQESARRQRFIAEMMSSAGAVKNMGNESLWSKK